MRIGILGPLEVHDANRPVHVAGGRVRLLLARLALDVDQTVSATTLGDAIWDGALPGDELHALQSLASRLRGALGDPGLVRQSGDGYRLALAVDDVDAARFDRLAAEGAGRLRDGDAAAAERVLGDALSLWRGSVLADLPLGGALAAAAGSLQDRRIAALADRAQALLRLDRGAELVAELEAGALAHPLHERLAAELMRSLSAAGRQADALAVYERVRARLDEELGAAPSPLLHEAHLAVLRGEAPPRVPAAANPSAEPARRGLPARLTSFVGRDGELAHVGELLASQRLVTLVGPGGAGKTRLALQLADRAADAREGTWLVELASVADGDAIAPALVAALGLREVQLLGGRAAVGGDALARVLEVLGERAALLVVDNCEHLLEPVARVVHRILESCPAVSLLCTSREPLGITGESIVPVAPLALPDGEVGAADALRVPAVRLFADRAASASAGFVVDETTVADVVEVCRRVDGLPLAIELAAARLRAMTLSQLTARLHDRLRLLTGGSRTAMARQQTLRAVVDWSWDLLSAPERALLRRLAVFPAGATLEAAQDVCAGGPVAADDVFDLLCALVDKSLLAIVDGQRWRMLETIREYGLVRCEEAGEIAARRAAHADHFSALAREAAPHLRGHEQLQWLSRLRADHDNLLAALRELGSARDARRTHEMVVDLLWFWLLSGSRQEVLIWTGFAAAIDGDADPLDRVLVAGVHTLVAAFSGVGEGEDPWRTLATLLQQIEGADLSAYPLLAALRPMLAVAVGRERVLELLEGSATHPDAWVRATVPFVRIQLSGSQGDLEEMRTALDQSLTAFGEVGDRWGLATTLSELATLRMVGGDLDGAEAALEQTRSLLAELGVRDGGASMRMRLSEVRMRRGDLRGAFAMLERTLADEDRLDEETAMLTAALAQLALLLGDGARARELSDDALARLGDRRNRPAHHGHPYALALSVAALVDMRAGDDERARRRLGDAYVAARGTEDMPLLATVAVATAARRHRAGDAGDAARLLGAAAALRGAEDPTHPLIARLTAALTRELGAVGFDAAFAAGRALDRDAVLAAVSDATAVGAQGERDEHREQSAHPGERPQHV